MKKTRLGIRWLLIVAMLLAAGGCVSTKTLPLRGSQWAGRSIVLVRRPLPGFAVMRSSKVALGALFGPLGGAAMGAAMAREGARLLAEDHMEDPAVTIGRTLLAQLSAADHLRIADSGYLTSESDPPKMIAAYPGTDLLLDVRTVGWQAMYFPTNWSHYGMLYTVQLRVIDTHSGAVVAQGFCAHRPQESADSPTYDELLTDWGARLKTLSKASGEFCLQDLQGKLFGAVNPVTARN